MLINTTNSLLGSNALAELGNKKNIHSKDAPRLHFGRMADVYGVNGSGAFPASSMKPLMSALMSASYDKPIWKQTFISPSGYPLILYTLSNGHRLLVEQRPSDHIGVRTFVDAGSILENSVKPSKLYVNTGLRSGMAHLDEHLHYTSTEHFPQKNGIESAIEQLGARYNATTSDETIQHEMFFNREDLEQALRLHADAVLRPCLTPEEINQEKNNVWNENSFRMGEVPYKIFDKLNELMFERPFRQTIGTLEDLRATTPQDLQRFRAQTYVPNNLLTVVTGNVDPQQVYRILAPEFLSNPYQGTPNGNNALRLALKPDEVRVATVTDPRISTGTVIFGFPAPSVNNYSERMAMEFITHMLSGSSLSVLDKDLVDEKHLADSVSSAYSTNKESGVCSFQLDTALGKEQAAASELLTKLAEFANKPIPKEEVEKTRQLLVQRFRSMWETTGAASNILGSEALTHSLPYVLNYEKMAAQMTPEYLSQVLRTYLTPGLDESQSRYIPNRYALVYGLPSVQQPATDIKPDILTAAPEQPATVNQNAAQNLGLTPSGLSGANGIPSVGMSASVSNRLVNTRLPNGANGYLMQAPTLRRSTLMLTIPTTAIPPGTDIMLSEAIFQGSTATKQKLEAWRQQGLRVNAAQSASNLIIYAEAPSGQESAMANAVLSLLKQPLVDPSTFNTGKAKMIQGTQQEIADPDTLLDKAMMKRIFGPNHRYSRTVQQTIDDLSRQTQSGVMAYYPTLLDLVGQSKAILVSPLPVENQQQLMNATFAALPVPQSNPSNSLDVTSQRPAIGRQQPVLLPNESVKRALIKATWQVPNVQDPDYAPFLMLLTLLRSGKHSFFETLRTQDQLVYAIQYDTEAHPLRKGYSSTFTPSIKVEFPKMGQAIQDIHKVTSWFCNNEIGSNELQAVKRGKLLELRRALETSVTISDLYRPWLVAPEAQLPSTAEMEAAINRVTPADIKRVANRIFNDPNALSLLGVSAPQGQLQEWLKTQQVQSSNHSVPTGIQQDGPIYPAVSALPVPVQA